MNSSHDLDPAGAVQLLKMCHCPIDGHGKRRSEDVQKYEIIQNNENTEHKKRDVLLVGKIFMKSLHEYENKTKNDAVDFYYL